MPIVTLRLLLLLVVLGRLNAADAGGYGPGVIDVVMGETLAFAASADSPTAVKYQWQKNGVDIPGAIGDILRFGSITLADAGVYYAIATNAVGSTPSNAVMVVVVSPPVAVAPVITIQPVNVQVSLNGNALFKVAASGTPAPSYQWLKDGSPIAGATSSGLSLSGVTTSAAYSVVVQNAGGSVVSQTANLIVNGASSPPVEVATSPVITRQPDDLQISPWGSAVFSVEATGTPTPTFQWQKDGVSIPGATGAFLSLSNLLSSASYSVVVSNSAGSVLSRAASLIVFAKSQAETSVPPAFTTQPSDQNVASTTSVTLVSAASGSPAPAYQWRKNGRDMYGATNASLTLSYITVNDVGTYSVVASNSAGAVESRGASVTMATVGTAPVFTSHPTSQSVVSGSSVTFTVSVQGQPGPSIQWRRNGNEIWGATASTLRLDGVTTNDVATYDVVARNSAGTTFSGGAALVVNNPYVPPAPPPPPPPAPAQDPVIPVAKVVSRVNSMVTVASGGKNSVSFEISGSVAKTILVRAVGPTLSTLGIGGAMGNPEIDLYGAYDVVARNDNWGGTAELMNAFSQAGAVPFERPDSLDSAFLVTLAPGFYNLIVSAADGIGGTVLIEVYEFL